MDNNQTKGPCITSHEPTDTATSPPRWNPGAVSRFPWLGFSGLFGVLACAVAVCLVLIYSDGRVVDDWDEMVKVSPNVLAVIFTTLANVLLAGVVAQGIAIAWWRRALDATTIRDLQRYWDHGDNIASCLRAGRSLSVIALATLSTKLVILDSALVQRATTVEPGSVLRSVEVNSRLATEYPPANRYYSSPMVGGLWNVFPTIFTREFGSVVEAYQSLDSAPINPSAFKPTRAIFEGCRSGTCISAVEGIGFAVNCSTTSESIDYGKFFWSEPGVANPDNIDVQSRPVFLATYLLRDPLLEPLADSIVIRMTTQYVRTVRDGTVFSCPGTLFNKTCDLRPAVVRYPMSQVVSQDNIGILMGNVTAPSLGRAPLNEQSKQIDGNSFVRYLFEFPPGDTEARNLALSASLNAIGGLSLFLDTTLSGNATIGRGGHGEPYDIVLSGPLAASYLSTPGDSVAPRGVCNYTIQDPTDDVVRRLNTVMFLASMQIASANDSTPMQTLTAQQTGFVQFYRTNYAFLASGIAILLLAVVGAVAPFYGFWQLGRKVTLSPIEVASAFQAPLLLHPTAPSEEIQELLNEVGDRPVQYGMISTCEGVDRQGQLAFAHPEAVVRLRK